MRTVAVIDDEIAICETIKLVLDDQFNVKIFTTCEACMAFCDEGNIIDIFVVDFKVGRSNGYEFFKALCTKIKKIPPAVLVSGYVGQKEDEYEVQAMMKYFSHRIQKPFDIMELRSIVLSFAK